MSRASVLGRASMIVLAVAGLPILGTLAWWTLRPHREFAGVPEGTGTWAIAEGRGHHAFVDLISWRGQLYLAHVVAPYHMGTPRSRVAVGVSEDGETFEDIAELGLPGRDIRDPKLAVVGGRLFLYVLANDSFLALPHETLLATSEDGRVWSDFRRIGQPGWLFWRPETQDGKTWWAPVFRPGEAVLVRSGDGIHWMEVSTIYLGADASETALALLPDGSLVATVRLEPPDALLLGSDRSGTMVAWAKPPYRSWRHHRTGESRLDGPALFVVDGRAYAVGRRQPPPLLGLTGHGGLLSRKRTALYRVEEAGLVHLGDLPSSGDTSYAGVVVREEDVLVAYYTSDPRRDPPWLLGMWLSTEVRVARIPREAFR